MPGEQFKFAFPQPTLPLDALFYDDQGRAALRILRQWREWPKAIVGLSGPERSGVTTVLKSWAREVDGRYLRPEDWLDLDAKAISELLDKPLALDDVASVRSSSSVLTMINLAVEADTVLLLGDHGKPSSWHQSPPDLVSRLSAMTTVILPTLDDESFTKRLRSACLRRYIRLPDETLNFIEPRLERSYQAIEAFVTALDAYMSETGRPPTIPLARDILDALTEATEPEEY